MQGADLARQTGLVCFACISRESSFSNCRTQAGTGSRTTHRSYFSFISKHRNSEWRLLTRIKYFLGPGLGTSLKEKEYNNSSTSSGSSKCIRLNISHTSLWTTEGQLKKGIAGVGILFEKSFLKAILSLCGKRPKVNDGEGN
jgi:hypothetical protein